MFTKIMIPVDLGHVDQISKALKVAADLSIRYSAEAHIVGVTQSSPTEIARTPEAYTEKLTAFAAERSEALGVPFSPHTEISHDPKIDLDDVLSSAASKIGADLIVMASHVPGFAERVFASNAGYLASHASMSVLVVR
jgi:nucleotide-binding universal stress UspA family protein